MTRSWEILRLPARNRANGPRKAGDPRDRSRAPKFGRGFDTIGPMRTPGPQNAYEVYCYRCNVTAPVGTRRCVHCGQPISRGEPDPRRAALAAPRVYTAPARLGSSNEPSPEVDQVREEAPPPIGSVAPKIAIWVLLLIGGFLYRFCN